MTEDWILATYQGDAALLWPMDARIVASAYSQFLRAFCDFSLMSEYNAIALQLAAPLLTPYALSPINFPGKSE